jgi:hypothetical protein
MKIVEKKWTKWEIAIAFGAVCAATVISASKIELDVWDKVSPQLDEMREMALWNANFAKKPRSESVDSIGNKPLTCAQAEAISQGIGIIQNNRERGSELWTGLTGQQMAALAGDEPICLGFLDHKGFAPVYFDKNRNGIIFDSVLDDRRNWRLRRYPKSLAAVCPRLQAIAQKFHLRESQYLPGIYGLDPAYNHEYIRKYGVLKSQD